jgi:hypothetical protein
VSTGAPIRTQGPDEAITLKDRSRPGRRAFSFAPLDVPEVLPDGSFRRRAPAGLP